MAEGFRGVSGPVVPRLTEERVRDFLDVLERLAAGDTVAHLPISDHHDELDAIAFGVNALVDELRFAHARITECERKDAETQATALRDELAHLGRVTMLDALTGSLAHELNQPLTAVMANTEAAIRMVQAQPLPLQDLRETLSDILNDNKRAGDVVWRMASMLKKGASQYQPIDVNRTVNDVIKLAQSNAVSRRISIDVRLDAGVDPVWGDRIQIQQVVLNLLINAFDAVAGCDAAHRRVQIQTISRERCAVIEVRDEGVGLSEDAMASLFEPFYTTKRDGLGLGLWICRGIVKAHGGTLDARSNVGPGMTFSTTFPVGRARENNAREAGHALPVRHQ